MPEESHAKSLEKEKIKEKPESTALTLLMCLAEQVSAYNRAEINRYHFQPCEQKQICLAHHSRMHSLYLHTQCEERKIKRGDTQSVIFILLGQALHLPKKDFKQLRKD